MKDMGEFYNAHDRKKEAKDHIQFQWEIDIELGTLAVDSDSDFGKEPC
jgi:hypothetical protein